MCSYGIFPMDSRMSSNQPWCISISVRATESLLYINTGRLRISGDDSRAPVLVDRVIAVLRDVGGSTSTGGICPNYFSDPIDQNIRTQCALSWKIVVSEWQSVIAVSLNVGGGVRLIKTGKTVHAQAKTLQKRVFEAMVSYWWDTRGMSLRASENKNNIISWNFRTYCDNCSLGCDLLAYHGWNQLWKHWQGNLNPCTLPVWRPALDRDNITIFYALCNTCGSKYHHRIWTRCTKSLVIKRCFGKW